MEQNNRWKPPHNFVQNLAIVLIGISFYLAMSNLNLVMGTVQGFLKIISPFIGGAVVAYLLDGPVRFFEKKLHMKRGWAVALALVLSVVVIALLISSVIPQLVQSIVLLANNATGYMESLNNFAQDMVVRFDLDEELMSSLLMSYNDIVLQITTVVKQILPQVLNYGLAFGSGLVSALTAIIASVYMLLGKNKLLSQLRKVVYAFVPLPRAQRVMAISSQANRVFTGFINGKLLDSAIIGVICFVVISIAKIEFPLLISVIIGVTNVIPFFGPFIGAIPCIMILLMVNPLQALEFAIFIIILQQFDGNILGPKILGDSTGLSAMWVLIAIITCGGLFGFTGMLIGVPLVAMLYSLASDVLAARLKAKNIDGEGNPLPTMPPPTQPVAQDVAQENTAEK